MNECRRCCLGYLGTSEIPNLHSNDSGDETPPTLGRIWTHLEFCARTGQRTAVRLCKCQSNGEAQRRSGIKGWRLDR